MFSEETGLGVVGGRTWVWDEGSRAELGLVANELKCPWAVGPSQHGFWPEEPPPPT